MAKVCLGSCSCCTRTLSAALVGLAVVGCGGIKTYPVEGTVRFEDGKPAQELAGGFVNFEPQEGNVSAVGVIRADGTYRLTTLRPNDGAPAGKYRVAVTPPTPPDPDRPPPPVMHPRFLEVSNSGLEFTVEKKKKNQIDIQVERAKRKP